MKGHQFDPECLEATDDGFFEARCGCGFSFGPAPDIQIVIDVLMAHAYDAGWDAARQEVQKP